MKAAVISFPGANCDQDLLWALKTLPDLSGTMIDERHNDLDGFDAVFLPGGFSYGDYLRSGAIARTSPVMTAIKAFAQRGGLVVGICNGFQILTEAGLLPGALQANRDQRFICSDETLVVANTATSFSTAYAPDQRITLPIAHGEGNYYADPETLEALEAHHQVVFRYHDNPNGSVHDIAGITNRAGNVLGMMPHPERAIEMLLGGIDGQGVFASMAQAVSHPHLQEV